jgi:glyoxylate carboligase
VNPEAEERYIAMGHESRTQVANELSLLQRAEWVTATAASLLGHDIPAVLGVDTANGIREYSPFLLRPHRVRHSSTTLEFTANE